MAPILHCRYGIDPMMKRLVCCASVLLALASWAAETVNFDSTKVGKLPSKWLGTQTGNGEAAWSVEKDDTAPSKPNVLVQTGEADFPVCIKQDTRMKDGAIEVRFKALSGKVDQAAGIIWRCQDKNNYYIARANALENDVRIFRMVKGKRDLVKVVSTKVTANEWHTLRVEFKGQHAKVSFDGTPVLEA